MAVLVEEFTLLQWAAMLSIAAVSGLMHGFVGIGFPLLATPLFALMFGFKLAVTLLVLPTACLTVCALIVFRAALQLRESSRRYWPLLLMMPFGVALGVEALHRLDGRWLMLMMAAMLLIFLLLDWLGHTDAPRLRRHPTALAFPFGLAAGVCEGSINVAAPVLLVYFLVLELPVASIIAVLNVLFLTGKTVQSILMAARGAFTAPVLLAVLPLTLIGIATYFTGLNLRKRFDPSRYRGWLKATLALTAVILVVQVLGGWLRA